MFRNYLRMKTNFTIKTITGLFAILLLLSLPGCQGGGSSSSTNPMIFESGISYNSLSLIYPPGDTNLLTQYITITVTDKYAAPGSSYSLYYFSPTQSQNQPVIYPLCPIATAAMSCTGSISMTNFLVYNVSDYFLIVKNNKEISSKYSAGLIHQAINTGLNNHNGPGISTNAWDTYQCGLEYPEQTAPAPQCSVGNGLVQIKTSYGCPTPSETITQSVAAFYYPNKFGDGNYGISCTAVPIADGSWVITGGHCVGTGSGGFFAPASQVYIMAGSPQLQNEYTPTQMAQVGLQVESEYLLKVAGDQSQCNNNCQYYADFALLKLKNYKFPNPVALIGKNTQLTQGEQVWIAGYGEHNITGGTIRNGQLNYRNEYFYSQNMNYGVLYSVGTMPDTSGYSWKFDGNGDSGGPLFIQRNNQLYLISTLTGGTYFDNAGINCKLPGSQIENMSVQYWEDDITGIINSTLPANEYIVDNQ